MKNPFKNRTLYILACFILGLFMASTISIAQEKTDEDVKKKYAAILGEYEFDLSDMGGGTEIINFHVEGGALWADSGDGRPVTMEPVGDEPFEFIAEDPVNGTFKIKFLKDDQGNYTICHIVNADIGLDIKGSKIK